MSKKSFADVMKSEKNGRRRVTELVCFSVDIATEYQALSLEFVEAKRQEDKHQQAPDPDKPTSGRRLAQKPKSVEILQQMQALVDDNSAAFYEVVFEQLPRADWLKLRAAHPPRDSHADDRGLFNAESFPLPAIVASMVDPEPTDEVVAYFESTLSNGETERLANLIWNLNEGVRSIPKGEAAMISLLLGGNETE